MSVIILSKNEQPDYETTKLLDSLTKRGIFVRVCQFHNFDNVVGNHQDHILYNGKKLELPKIVLTRMGAGITQTELSVVRQFELEGVVTVNKSTAIDVVKDKFLSSQLLTQSGIAVPTTMLVKSINDTKTVSDFISFPCVVKVVVGSYGRGVYLCHDELEYKKIVEFSDSLHNNKQLIVQEYLGDRPGEDLRVLVINGKVIGVMKRTAPPGDFRANISNGGTGESVPASYEIEQIAIKTAEILGLDIGGIDLLYDYRGFRVCEANSNPGFKGFDQYCNTEVSEHIADFIEQKIKQLF